ncbi:7599_t:CDS:2, partial [Rhizophagus irregularis]
MNYREKGNKAFVYGGFETARQEYTKGIEVTPEEPRLWSTMRKSSLNLVVELTLETFRSQERCTPESSASVQKLLDKISGKNIKMSPVSFSGASRSQEF